MFHAIKSCMGTRKIFWKDAPYFPVRYLRRSIVAYILNHRRYFLVKKKWSLGSSYGVEREDIHGYQTPFSFKDYCLYLLDKRSWGDDVVLTAFSRMHGLRITVINAPRLEEYRVRHDVPLHQADMVLVYNGRSHYSAAGK